MQCVLAVGENVSKQMVKFVCNITKESIIDVEGKVSTAEDMQVKEWLAIGKFVLFTVMCEAMSGTVWWASHIRNWKT